MSAVTTTGNCLLLDDGGALRVRPEHFPFPLCRWFRVAVLPLDGALEAALLYRGSRKRCAVCGAFLSPKSNRGKYCPDCAAMKRINAAAKRRAKQREKCHAFRAFQTRINQGFFARVKGGLIHLSFSPETAF